MGVEFFYEMFYDMLLLLFDEMCVFFGYVFVGVDGCYGVVVLGEFVSVLFGDLCEGFDLLLMDVLVFVVCVIEDMFEKFVNYECVIDINIGWVLVGGEEEVIEFEFGLNNCVV